MKMVQPTDNRRWNEFIGLLYAAGALLILLSLLSYSSQDASWNSVSSSAIVENWVGRLGSYGADLFYQLFGLCSYFFPLALGIISWKWMSSQQIDSPRIKLTGSFLLLFSLATGLSLIPYQLMIYQSFPVGGAIGVLLAQFLRSVLNGPGSAILVTVILLGSLYLLTSFTVVSITTWLDAHTLWLKAWLQKLTLKFRKSERKNLIPVVVSRTATLDKSRSEFASGKPRIDSPMLRKATPETVNELDHLSIPIQPPVENSRLLNRTLAVSSTMSRTYKFPSTDLLRQPGESAAHNEEELSRRASVLTTKCDEFGARGTITQINPGPVVTTFEFKPEAGVKYNRITNLAEDLCLAMEAESILVERIPGKSTVGIEVPNLKRETIALREILESEAFASARSSLTVSLGKEINGRIRVADLAAMPHLLIAGSTGSGKSVALNCLIVSLLYRATPDDVKLMLVDPKRLELGLYEGIPHLLTPIITDPKVAANALRNVVKEMERRLKLLAEKGVRSIDQYNRSVNQPGNLKLFDQEKPPEPLPYIVVIIDELADLMMIDKNVEVPITRLAQMARAVGIHLVLATQRPSVDVITGLIKANFPSRISFRVATKVDSRTILDTNGAEALLGKGDMLFSPPGSGRLVRVHGSLVTEEEIAKVVDFWRAQATPSYVEEFLQAPADAEPEQEEWSGDQDENYQDAVRIVVEMGKASTSILQRRLRLGYGRAARLLDIMEKDGIIGPPDGSRPREVLKRPDWVAEVEQA
ncbi:MAG: hypothetical protein A3F68_01750 [Acidobacteria bacterium RIFCSPLOWO2_12_FULL_54_10]|nr:MAG: hypothetical protein A3F68_01750 [Acidobacteria bacterium RIFCSPLOWO2_12_FULL_54_10]